MRIIIDLDGTICEIKKKNQTYSEVKLKEGAKDFIDNLKKDGHYIIIHTARNMRTCNSNIGKVNKNIGLITLQWLKTNEIQFDEIYFGKPNGDIYIDDRSIRFNTWNELSKINLKSIAKDR